MQLRHVCASQMACSHQPRNNSCAAFVYFVISQRSLQNHLHVFVIQADVIHVICVYKVCHVALSYIGLLSHVQTGWACPIETHVDIMQRICHTEATDYLCILDMRILSLMLFWRKGCSLCDKLNSAQYVYMSSTDERGKENALLSLWDVAWYLTHLSHFSCVAF